ncbi:hypothetical protein M899_2408 [Bacteriovorax sp. BSW11_IV]|uniref:hypothetical protein n=1 Tax=Bacteriovorax sp. BSW11_IV TaxID=1353529 RepID=UPI00038A1274|nr:hypothetical protein [Bacteriovorax sp. BSW11_IV]EQC44522.1 hypothetical protein M899_2408 [Bacteriovorax sp. BSW11_IV]
MKFSCSIEDINLVIEVNKIKFSSTNQHYLLTKKDQNEMNNGEICFYEIIITSEVDGEKMTHYSPGHALTAHEEDLMEEVEHVLDDSGLLDKVVDHWNLNEEEGPRWKIKT